MWIVEKVVFSIPYQRESQQIFIQVFLGVLAGLRVPLGNALVRRSHLNQIILKAQIINKSKILPIMYYKKNGCHLDCFVCSEGHC